MDGADKEDQLENNNEEIKIFNIPFSLAEFKKNIYINNTVNETSKEEIIHKASKFHSEGKLKEAEKYYQDFVNRGFKDHSIFSNYGSLLKGFGRLKEAELSFRKAIDLKPDFAEAHYNLAIIFQDLGKTKEAEILTRKAIEIKPNFSEAYYHLGNILESIGKLKEAELSLRKAIELKPDFAEVYFNLGSILRDFGKLTEAELSLRNVIKLKPDFAEAYSNLGNILKALGKLEEAESSLHKAIEIRSDYSEAIFNLSLIQMLKGDYKSGLKNYEFRFLQNKSIILHAKPKIKRIADKKIEKNKKLLVISEQGLGDTLQFMRYIPYLRSQGLDVLFSAQKQLHSLIKASDIDLNPLTQDQTNIVSGDQWIPLLSIPKYLDLSPNNPIITNRYIFSTKKLINKWRSKLIHEKRPIIGINWQGNPNAEKGSQEGRSIPLEIFSILAKNNNLNFLSLQKGFGSQQLDECSFRGDFVSCQSEIDLTWDFLENAAIIENCDLIITSDTSIAHLAGGLGKKSWLLLKDIPDWRWGLRGKSTFWYSSMKLFRQTVKHDWPEVMNKVLNELKVEGFI